MRDASFAVIREIGVETGGSNIQFCVHPETGRMIVIEMNPRVSRSSALASKATGFPIAKIAARLAVGYTLDEIKNDITRETPASFEPSIDYVVVKIPRFTFEKFPLADATLTTQMKSIGEAMAIGRTFKEAMQKALRSLEIKRFGLIGDGAEKPVSAEDLRKRLVIPNVDRIFYLGQAFSDGMSVEEIFELTKIDRWFLEQLRGIVEESRHLKDELLQIHEQITQRWQNALASEASLLLLDEPTALLDPSSQTDALELVHQLSHRAEQPLTALWITHRLEELLLCDGAAVMDQGPIGPWQSGKALAQQLGQQRGPLQSGRAEG
jgi:hypothetical protein